MEKFFQITARTHTQSKQICKNRNAMRTNGKRNLVYLSAFSFEASRLRLRRRTYSANTTYLGQLAKS